MKSLLKRVMWDVYEKQIRYLFRFHPNGTNLVNAMRAGQLTVGEIDQAFNEAEYYAGKKMNDYVTKRRDRSDSGDTVTFSINRRRLSS